MIQKLSDLRPCDACQGPVGMQFYVLRMSLAFVRRRAVEEFLGMSMFFGGKAPVSLVENFAPAAADAIVVAGDTEPSLLTELLICNSCFLDRPIDLAHLMERRNATEPEA